MAVLQPASAPTALPGRPSRRHVLSGALLAGLGSGHPGVFGQGSDVDLALVLAIDCSWSVDAAEFHLQMHGMAEAFRRPEIQRAIASGVTGRIIVAGVQWSHENKQNLAVPWTLIAGSDDAAAFAAVLDATERDIVVGATAIWPGDLPQAAAGDHRAQHIVTVVGLCKPVDSGRISVGCHRRAGLS